MISGIDRDEVIEFVSVQDKGESKTIFIIGNITNRQKMAVIGEVLDDNGAFDARKLQSKTMDILKIGLKAIKNIYSPIEKKCIDMTTIDEGVLDNIPFDILFEVAAKIVEINFTGASRLKN